MSFDAVVFSTLKHAFRDSGFEKWREVWSPFLDGLKPQKAPFSKGALWGRAHERHNLRSNRTIIDGAKHCVFEGAKEWYKL